MPVCSASDSPVRQSSSVTGWAASGQRLVRFVGAGSKSSSPWSSCEASAPARLGRLGPAAGRAHRLVSDVADGADQRFVLRAEFGPQATHVYVDRAGTAEEVVAPHLLQQLCPGGTRGRRAGRGTPSSSNSLQVRIEGTPTQACGVGASSIARSPRVILPTFS